MRAERPKKATPSRKAEHLRINLEQDVGAKGVDAGFDAYRFAHRALPEIDLLRRRSVGRNFWPKTRGAASYIVHDGWYDALRAGSIGDLLASHKNTDSRWALDRVARCSNFPSSIETFDVRPLAPDVALLANLGAVQLNKGYGLAECRASSKSCMRMRCPSSQSAARSAAAGRRLVF